MFLLQTVISYVIVLLKNKVILHAIIELHNNQKGCNYMPVPQERIYTSEDYWNLPEGQRAELIDGKIYYMAPPNTKHQRLVSDLHYQIKDFIKQNNGECEIFPSPFAVFLDENDRNYVEPDLSVICDKNKITDKGCNGAPDWVIEIVSPSSKQMDYFKKLFKYRTAGVREYWVVDSERELVTIYNFEKDSMEEYAFDKNLPVGIYEGVSLKLSRF